MGPLGPLGPLGPCPEGLLAARHCSGTAQASSRVCLGSGTVNHMEFQQVGRETLSAGK